MHCVIETDAFVRAAKNSGLSDDEKHGIVQALAENPLIGELIPGTGGARKWRYGRGGKGKRSGYRVITYYADHDVPVFLMDIYAKGERIDLSQAERNELKKVLTTVADDYRRSIKERVTGISEKAS